MDRKIFPGKIEILDKKLFHQLKNVFRLREGGEVEIFDGSGFDFPAKIERLFAGSVSLLIGQGIKNDKLSSRRMILFQSIIKKDNFEWVVQKCVEIGVAEIVPVISERSEKKNINLNRLAFIAKEATEQSGRILPPLIRKPILFREAIDLVSGEILVLDSTGVSLKGVKDAPGEFKVFVGPEGGWSESEMALFKKKGTKILSLGNATLRSETAAVVVSAILLL